jgi:predicted nucleotidyltransferase|nr:nucleotidyltransferase domain-containing protein [Neorhizobium tomejilense]
MNRMEALIERRTETRYKTASVRAERILEDARKHGVEMRTIGSLAKRSFHLHSDVDLLVSGPVDPARRLFIERLVADHMRGTDIPYDLIFAADMTADRVQELLDGCV